MGYLSKAQILNADDVEIRDVAVPEWGGDVRVKALTGRERDALEKTMLDGKPGKAPQVNLSNFRAKLCAASMVDENGARLFSERDVEQLGAKSSKALARVFDVASKLSGFTDTDIEELTKNSESGQSDDSGTA